MRKSIVVAILRLKQFLLTRYSTHSGLIVQKTPFNNQAPRYKLSLS